MFSNTKKILSLILVLTLCLAFNTISDAKTKKMFMKQPTVMQTKKGKKVIVPKYHRVDVELTKIVLAPIPGLPSAIDELKKRYSWLLPKKAEVVIDNKKGMIKTDKMTDKKPEFDIKVLPYNTFKSYMSYRAITATGSPQYKLQHGKAYTDYDTGVRMVEGRYCIAVGPKVASKIGTKLELVYDSGKKVPAIVSDQKGGTVDGYRHPDGSAIEFVVDNSALPRVARLMGDMSVLKKFKGRVVKIKVFKKRRKE